ncbi:MAG: tRNA (N6-threonylcarbamoyladenosine(37)-N6)-methyltransferase TrmO [Oscillospiraceae bacterium]|nr:tRNA (N6-threonylcarbamoyladenosine(37)-N6)-methyltransferase TrmO [Oscillospiraceae bacterium]
MDDIILKPVGHVLNSVKTKKDDSWGGDISKIVLSDEYCGGLAGLEDFSHCIIIFYLDKAEYIKEKHLQRRPRNREDMPLTGIFAQRGKDRPNHIGITCVEIVSVTDKELTVRGLDAVDMTPVLDIKPYFPDYDKRDASVPEWVTRLMQNYF